MTSVGDQETDATPEPEGAADPIRGTDGSGAGQLPKPRKKRGPGNVWTTVTATPEQRVIISDLAAKAGLSISSYLVQCGMKGQVVPRSDWRQAVALLTEVNTQLAEVSALLEDRATPIDAVQLGIRLWHIEEAARGLLTPEQRAIARVTEVIDLTALGRARAPGARTAPESTGDVESGRHPDRGSASTLGVATGDDLAGRD